MDLIAEIVLGWVDVQIAKDLCNRNIKILRYRDDYRIFSNDSQTIDDGLKAISDNLRSVGMILGASKTKKFYNVIEGTIKNERLAALSGYDSHSYSCASIRNQLLKFHAFGRLHPNSGALEKVMSNYCEFLRDNEIKISKAEFLIAVVVDIAVSSPVVIKQVVDIVNYIFRKIDDSEKNYLWGKIVRKMRSVPQNGFLDIWLQRLVYPDNVKLEFSTDEKICNVVSGNIVDIWRNEWINNMKFENILCRSNILKFPPTEVDPVIDLGKINVFHY